MITIALVILLIGAVGLMWVNIRMLEGKIDSLDKMIQQSSEIYQGWFNEIDRLREEVKTLKAEVEDLKLKTKEPLSLVLSQKLLKRVYTIRLLLLEMLEILMQAT